MFDPNRSGPIDTTETTFKCHECHTAHSFSTTDVRLSHLKSSRTDNAECPGCGAAIGPHNTTIDP